MALKPSTKEYSTQYQLYFTHCCIPFDFLVALLLFLATVIQVHRVVETAVGCDTGPGFSWFGGSLASELLKLEEASALGGTCKNPGWHRSINTPSLPPPDTDSNGEANDFTVAPFLGYPCHAGVANRLRFAAAHWIPLLSLVTSPEGSQYVELGQLAALLISLARTIFCGAALLTTAKVSVASTCAPRESTSLPNTSTSKHQTTSSRSINTTQHVYKNSTEARLRWVVDWRPWFLMCSSILLYAALLVGQLCQQTQNDIIWLRTVYAYNSASGGRFYWMKAMYGLMFLLPLNFHAATSLATWALMTTSGCLVDRQLLGSYTAGWATYAVSLLVTVVASSLAVLLIDARMRRSFGRLCRQQQQQQQQQGAGESMAKPASDVSSKLQQQQQDGGSSASSVTHSAANATNHSSCAPAAAAAAAAAAQPSKQRPALQLDLGRALAAAAAAARSSSSSSAAAVPRPVSAYKSVCRAQVMSVKVRGEAVTSQYDHIASHLLAAARAHAAAGGRCVQAVCVPGCVQLLGLVLEPCTQEEGDVSAGSSAAALSLQAAVRSALRAVARCGQLQVAGSPVAGPSAEGFVRCVWPPCLAAGQGQQQLLQLLLLAEAGCAVRLVVAAGAGGGQQVVLLDEDVAVGEAGIARALLPAGLAAGCTTIAVMAGGQLCQVLPLPALPAPLAEELCDLGLGLAGLGQQQQEELLLQQQDADAGVAADAEHIPHVREPSAAAAAGGSGAGVEENVLVSERAAACAAGSSGPELAAVWQEVLLPLAADICYLLGSAAAGAGGSCSRQWSAVQQHVSGFLAESGATDSAQYLAKASNKAMSCSTTATTNASTSSACRSTSSSSSSSHAHASPTHLTPKGMLLGFPDPATEAAYLAFKNRACRASDCFSMALHCALLLNMLWACHASEAHKLLSVHGLLLLGCPLTSLLAYTPACTNHRWYLRHRELLLFLFGAVARLFGIASTSLLLKLTGEDLHAEVVNGKTIWAYAIANAVQFPATQKLRLRYGLVHAVIGAVGVAWYGMYQLAGVLPGLLLGLATCAASVAICVRQDCAHRRQFVAGCGGGGAGCSDGGCKSALRVE